MSLDTMRPDRLRYTLCLATAVLFMSGASASPHKCVKDGRTTYQDQPCDGRAAAAPTAPASKPSSWVGCYASGSGTRQTIMEVRQEGETLYTSQGSEGPHERRVIWALASPRQLLAVREAVGRQEKDGIEFTSGIAMSGAALGRDVKSVADGEQLMGYWWTRGIDIEGDPLGHLPRTRETLRSSKPTLYFIGYGTFEKASEVPCGAGK